MCLSRSADRDATHFAHLSAHLPVLRLTNPNFERQNTSSESADARSMRWRSILGAEVGSEERRWDRGWRGFSRRRHFLGVGNQHGTGRDERMR